MMDHGTADHDILPALKDGVFPLWLIKEQGYEKTFEAYKHFCDNFATGEYRDMSYNVDFYEALAKTEEKSPISRSKARP